MKLPTLSDGTGRANAGDLTAKKEHAPSPDARDIPFFASMEEAHASMVRV